MLEEYTSDKLNDLTISQYNKLLCQLEGYCWRLNRDIMIGDTDEVNNQIILLIGKLPVLNQNFSARCQSILENLKTKKKDSLPANLHIKSNKYSPIGSGNTTIYHGSPKKLTKSSINFADNATIKNVFY